MPEFGMGDSSYFDAPDVILEHALESTPTCSWTKFRLNSLPIVACGTKLISCQDRNIV
uniref:Uncharacterized protein n=1 Tax=Peronospora matthiolae TaxID=2874970 RepID=A0AAV1TZY4_9STRA